MRALIYEPASRGNDETCVGTGEATIGGSEEIWLQQHLCTAQIRADDWFQQGLQLFGQCFFVVVCLRGEIDALIAGIHEKGKKKPA